MLEENQCKISLPLLMVWPVFIVEYFSVGSSRNKTKTTSVGFHIPLSRQGLGPEADLLAREVFRGPVVLVRGLLAPALTSMSRYSDGHLPPVVLPFALQTLIHWARRGWRCCLNGGNTLQ